MLKKRTIFMLFLLLFSSSAFAYGQEDTQGQYAKPYWMELGSDTILTFDGIEQIIPIKYPSYTYNSAYLLPLKSMASASGFTTQYSQKDGLLSIFIGEQTLSIRKDIMTFNGYEQQLLIPPVFDAEECYVAFHDLEGVIQYDALNQIFSWQIGDTFLEDLKEQIQRRSIQTVSVGYVGTDKFFKNAEAVVLDTPIYIRNGYVMLPIRIVFSIINPDAEIVWNKDTGCAKVHMDSTETVLDASANSVLFNGEKIHINGTLEIQKNRLFVPLRVLQAIQGLSDYDIYWDAYHKTVYLRT